MKSFIIGLLLFFSTSTFAQIIYPSVYNTGYSAQISVNNNTDKSISCSGNIMMYLEDNTTESRYVYIPVSPRFSTFQTVSPMSFKRINYLNHSILCY